MTENTDKQSHNDNNHIDVGRGNKKVVQNLLFATFGMFLFGFALVPLYDVFCEYTGLNGKTGVQYVSEEQMQVDTTREIKVEFIANIGSHMPWEFKPVTHAVRVHPGEATRIEYIVKNKTSKDIIGRAVPSVAPGQAAAYFQKTECFCFTEQVLKAGEEKIMPVVFIIDPAIDEDVHEITLSYTFFKQPQSEDVSATQDKKSTLVFN